MIRKIVSIKNTGKFRACTPKFLLNKFTVIYSENGRGKTTLSNIFRSLHEQDGSFIIGRKTLGGSGEQVVELLSEENKLVSFKGNQWQSRPNFDIEIFDSTFVSQNVYSRHIIEHDQKKQLYLFTIGKHGGQLADRLVAVDEQIKQKKADKKNLEKVLLSGVESLLSVTDFVGLTQISNIDEEIHKQSQLLKALEKQSEINSKPLCAKISLPLFDKDKFRANLAGITLENLLDNAEDLTKQHIQQHLDPQGEKWLEYGVSKIIEEEKCPFCGQEIKGVAVVTAFKTYFSDQYKKAIHTINHLESAFATKFAVHALLTLQQTVQTNLELIAYWNTYDAIELECQLDWEWIRVTWDEFTKSMGSLIAEKKLMPLEQINISAEKELIIERYLTLLDKLGFYNHEIGRVNSIIEARKAMSEKHRIQDAKTKLSYLMNVKLRYSDEKAVQAEQHTQLLISIKALEKEKDDAKKKLNDYTKEIFSKYEQKINRHLMNCGASFKITDYKSSFIGGKPSSNFVLTINNNVVDLGNERSPLTNPSFKNTLSEGDKSSLAIAFFLAKLESDPDIGKKVLVFDDPISSLDNHRKSYTADQIMRYSALAKQVIVLTHDTFFARALWGKFADKKTLMSQLCIKREGLNDSILDTWDIEKETRSDYYQLYHTLADFIEGKVAQTNYRSVAMCIRPILEGNLRVRFPRDFDSNDWLGGFIQKVRTSTEVHLSSIKHQLDDLEDINDYSKKYHHDQNPNADSESINELELSTYVQRTLEALRGLHSATH